MLYLNARALQGHGWSFFSTGYSPLFPQYILWLEQLAISIMDQCRWMHEMKPESQGSCWGAIMDFLHIQPEASAFTYGCVLERWQWWKRPVDFSTFANGFNQSELTAWSCFIVFVLLFKQRWGSIQLISCMMACILSKRSIEKQMQMHAVL